MKVLGLVLIAVLGSSQAFAEKKPQKITMKVFLDTVASTINQFSNSDNDCTIKAKNVSGGVKITVIDGKDSTTLDVPSGADVAMADRSRSDDDSMIYYLVGGQGALVVEQASDAFAKVGIISKGKQTNCEIDF